MPPKKSSTSKTASSPSTVQPTSKTTTSTPTVLSTPPKLPKDRSTKSIAKYISSLATKINEAIDRHKSTRSEDKEEIRVLAKAIFEATSTMTTTLDVQTVVTNISATDLLTSIKEEMSKAIGEMKNTSDVPMSYSKAAQSTSNKTMAPSRPAIVVSSKDENHKHEEVLDVWRKKVSFKDSGFAPARMQRIGNNKLRFEFDDDKQRQSTINKLKNVESLKVEDAKRIRPMMIIKGIHKDTDSKELIELIKAQNKTIEENATSDNDIRLCFLRKNRNDKLYNAVIETTPEVRRIMAELTRVNIDFQRVHVSDFSPFKQCYKCLGFGHTKNKCKSDADFQACSHCASTEHKFEDCPDKKDNTKRRCYNCHQHNIDKNASVNDAHSATSTKHCPRVQALLKRINESVDYGY